MDRALKFLNVRGVAQTDGRMRAKMEVRDKGNGEVTLRITISEHALK